MSIATGSGRMPDNKRTPRDSQEVEVLVDGEWVKARFIEGGSSGDYIDGSYTWWFDYFSLSSPDYIAIPADVQSGDDLPEWREIVQ